MRDRTGTKSSTDVMFNDPDETIKDGGQKVGKARPRPLTFGRFISSISVSKSSGTRSEKSSVVSPRTALSMGDYATSSIAELEPENSTSSLHGDHSELELRASAANFLAIPSYKGSRSGCDVRDGSASGDHNPTDISPSSRPNRHTVGSFDQVIREHGAFEFGSVPPSPMSPLSNRASRDLASYAGSSSEDILATFDLTEDDLGEAAMQDYSVGRTLGRGRYGKVKQATHRLSDVPVALKIISKKALSENKEIANEVHALRELRHKNVMRMYDVVDTPNALVLVLELLDGGELFDYIVVRTKLSEKEARKFLRQILLGLRYCHARGIVHRDLKLENMLLDSNGDVKIGDFGFSNIFKADSLMSTFVGSAAYAAPEILANEQYVGPATDVWSLGVIMYTLLVGKQPFDHSGNQATFFLKVQAAEFEVPDFITPEAQDMIKAILRRNPQERPTVAELCKHRWILVGDDFDEADLPDTDAANNDIDGEGGLDAAVVEQLAGSGISTDTLGEDLAAGNLTRATAAYKLCKIGRVRDAVNREQDAEINAIANMLAATRISAGNSPLMTRKRVPANMKGHNRVASEFGMERRVMSPETSKPLKRSPKASKKESFMTALSLGSGTSNDEEACILSSPKSSKSASKFKPVPRVRATTVSASVHVDEINFDHPAYEQRVNDEKRASKRAATAQPAAPPASTTAAPIKSPRSVAKKSSENELSRNKGTGSPLASRRETCASLSQDAQAASSGLSINKSKESILSSRLRISDAGHTAIEDDASGESTTDAKHTASRATSMDASVDGMDISCSFTVEPPSPPTPTPGTPTTPMARRPYARYASERGATPDTGGHSLPMSRVATEDPSRADFSSMPFLNNGGEIIQGDAGMAYSSVTLNGDGTSASSPIRRKKSKMAHLRDMLAWGHGRDSISSISSSSSVDSSGTPRARTMRKGEGDADNESTPHMARGQSKHTVLSSATTSNKSVSKIVDEIVRVCKANKVKYVREGNIVMCIWKPGKKELRQLQDEVVILDNDVTIRWEMEVHKIDKMDLHGIRLRRTGGDIWLYKTLCTKLIDQMKL